MTLTPAYGRDYKSIKEVKADWDANRDFIIADVMHPYSGKPANKRDLKAEGTVYIRYQDLKKVAAFSTI